jgi:hypothetical protein
MNQGMLMESLNLASVWKLPVLFVCKDDGWAITTQSGKLTGGDLGERVRGLGVAYAETYGSDVWSVWKAAGKAIESARSGQGPTFLHVGCVHFEGHFLGYQPIRIVRDPLRELFKIAGPLVKSLFQPSGGRLRARLAGLKIILETLFSTFSDPRRDPGNDPLLRMRTTLQSEPGRLEELEGQIEDEIRSIITSALVEMPS